MSTTVLRDEALALLTTSFSRQDRVDNVLKGNSQATYDMVLLN